MSPLHSQKYKKTKYRLMPRSSKRFMDSTFDAIKVGHAMLYILLLVLALAQYSYKAYAIGEESINKLKVKACLIEDKEQEKSAFTLEIQGTQQIEYKTMFIEANAQNQHRFLIDINNSIDRIKVDDIYVASKKMAGPIPLFLLLESSSFPVSKLVAAQNSLNPPITRIVFHLRQKVSPIVEVDDQLLKVKIPIPVADNKLDANIPLAKESSIETDNNVNLPAINQSYKQREVYNVSQIAQNETSSETETPIVKPQIQESKPIQQGQRPAILEAIKPVFLPKTTKIEIISDGQLKIKQVRLSKGGILRIELYNATTSLPRTISIDKGILRNATFEENSGDLSIFINLTEPVIYELESMERGIVITFQNPLLEQLVSINVNEEPMSSVLLMLFTQYGANIIAGSKISGRVTARLVDVPLKAALDEILKVEGFGYLEEGGLIRVVTSDELKAKEVKAEEAIQKPTETLSKVFDLTYAKASDIQQLIQKIVGDNSNILTDQRTNALILISSTSKEAFDEKAKKIEELLVKLDVEVSEENKLTPEQQKAIQQAANIETSEKVEIVKKIFRLHYLDPENAKTILTPLLSDKGTLEAVIMKKEKQGGGSGGDSGGSGGSGGSSTAGADMQLSEAVGQGGYIVVSDVKEVMDEIEKEVAKLDLPTPQVEIEAFIVEGSLSNNSELGVDWASISKGNDVSFSFSGDQGLVITKGIIPVEKFTGILNMLANNNKLKVISNPTITTLEGQQAMFHSGDRIPYSRIYIQQGIEQIDTVFEEVGIVLAATPYVKEHDMVSLVLSTSVSSESGFTPSGQPRISTRTTKSQVLVKSGDTVVIAGLNSEKDSNTVSKVPILGDIPILGKVFTTESSVKQRSEVTIFITPRIVAVVPPTNGKQYEPPANGGKDAPEGVGN